MSVSNVQEAISDGKGGYQWDMIDGYDELKYVLLDYTYMLFVLTYPRSDHPDVQEKIRRVITQGHIDPDDFNGVSWRATQYWTLTNIS